MKEFLMVFVLFSGLKSYAGPVQSANKPTIKFRAVDEKDCSAVDVRDFASPELAQQMRQPENQGNSGICFAITSSTLWSYQKGVYFSGLHKWSQYDHRLNFIDRSWRYASRVAGENTIVLDGGMLRDAILESQEDEGLCLNSAVLTTLPEDLAGNEKTPRLSDYKVLNKALADRESDKFEERVLKSRFPRYFPSLTTDYILQVLKSNKKIKTVPQAIYILGKAACKENMISLKDEKVEVVTRQAGVNYLLDYVNEQLSKTKPNMVGMMYDASTTIGSGRAGPLAHMIGVHVSPIIGRAFNQQRGYCEFLIRDSFGMNKDQYITGLFGSGKKDGYEKMIRPNGDGTFWISDVDLFQSMASISYIVPQGEKQSEFNPYTGQQK